MTTLTFISKTTPSSLLLLLLSHSHSLLTHHLTTLLIPLFISTPHSQNCPKAYHSNCMVEELTEEQEKWICDWHKCLLCKQCSKYQCYGCPNAVCQHCFKDVAFARVRGSKGLCNNCLNLALLGDEGMEIDSDGEKVDFKDRETYEGLFKEYWDIIKEKEGLTLEDLHHADVQIKKDKNARSYYLTKDENINPRYQKIDSDSEEYSKENENKQSASDNHDSDDALQPILARTEMRPKKLQKKCKGSQTIEFVGWASRSLIEFLESIGVDTNKKLSQDDVASIINKYAQDQKLFHPEKKAVLCDSRLCSLLGRTTINMYKIDDLLEPHFLENVVQLEDDDEDEDEGFSPAFKKENTSLSTKKQAWWRKLGSIHPHGSFLDKFQPEKAMSEEAIREESAVKVQHSTFASITLKNMKLIYLKRCLVEHLMKHYETFESKAIGSFVKVKSDPYQLLPIAGISKPSSGDGSNRKILLQISTVPNEVPICLLSNDDLSEDDCENLRQKVDNGLLKKLTVVEVEEKAKSLNEDITKHWIARELSILRHRIDLANEKGRRAELFEYRRRKELLQSEEEQSRLLKELPQVIADVIEIEPVPEPSPKPTSELVHKPASKPARNPTSELVHKPTSEPAPKPAPKPASESASMSASETDESQDNTDVGTVVCALASIENYRGKRYPPLSAPHNFRGCVKAYHPRCAGKQEAVEESSEERNLKYRETYADLFKACQDIIKEKGSLTIEDLHKVDVLIKTGKNKRSASNDHDVNGSLQPMLARITKRPKRLQEKYKGSKKIEFVGWASKSLIEFLGSIGVDTNKKHSQDDVASLINKYVHDQKLFHPEKKKVVLCDIRLRSLLGRTTFNLYKVLDLLEPHFFENIEQSEDENEDESSNLACEEKEKAFPSTKKQAGLSKCGSLLDEFQPKIPMSEEVKRKESAVEVQYSSFATITLRNMNLVYLKRCLVEQLMKQNVDFKDKVVGSFVKVKSGPVDAKHPYRFLPVTGINKVSGGDSNGKIFLQILTLPNKVPICLLSNDNLSEEDCDYLQQKVEDGLLEKPTVVELEQKAKSLHEDMTKHWINRELSILRHRIDLANEKGRRAELFEYRRRRELLQSQEEQLRLLKEVPQVIADVIEIKTASKPASATDAEHASDLASESTLESTSESEGSQNDTWRAQIVYALTSNVESDG